MSLAGGAAREVNVKVWDGLSDLSWADGKGLFVSEYQTGARKLLYVDLEGWVEVLWDLKLSGGITSTWGTPSPNGRYLALLGYTVVSNLWMLENFEEQ